MILVFAGAGASKAVSERYATTQEFLARLPSSVTDDVLFGHVRELLRQNGDPTIDIELVLSALDEIHADGERISIGASPLGYLLAGNRIRGYLNLGMDFTPFAAYCGALGAAAKALKDTINTLVYDAYSVVPTATQLESNWLALLRGLNSRETAVEVFTTNYDPVVEVAVDRSELPLDLGRRRDGYEYLDVELWNQPRVSATGRLPSRRGIRGYLTKLHGSLDWTRRAERIEISSPRFRGRHDEHVILYPGFKGTPTSEPFLAFHRHFADSLSVATGVVFVGFAFRDTHINTLIEQRLSDSARVCIIDPHLAEANLPEKLRSRAKRITLPFAAEAVDAALAYLPA